jgi:NADPH-dependent 2,4-dienoyl-CoA reductase/sulfur reductase-like enzyme
MMMRGLGAEIGRVLARRHADNGTHLRLGCGVASLAGRDRVEGVVLDDGSTIDADLVVVGIGVDPAVDWLADCGIDVRGGVACDAHLRVRDGVYVVGDAARWTSGAAGTRRLEHWTNAVDQAAALADTLTGRPTPYDPTPYVWSDQLGTRLRVWGDVAAEHEIVYLAGDADSEEFVAACGSLQGMHGVVALGARREAMRAARLLHAGAQWRAGVGPVERVA